MRPKRSTHCGVADATRPDDNYPENLIVANQRLAVPDFPYFFATAEGIFRLGFSAYIREAATGDSLLARAQNIQKQLRDSGHPDPPGVARISRTLKALEKPEFERSRRAYFAMDDFPENDQRFTVSYDDVNGDAARGH